MSHLSTGLQLIGEVLGFLSSVLLMWGALRATPLQNLIERADKVDKAGPGGAFAVAARSSAEAKLQNVKVIEGSLLLVGLGLLILSFLASLASHFF